MQGAAAARPLSAWSPEECAVYDARREFELLKLLATDKEATQTVVEAITQRALRLSPHAIVIVAGVVGAPSPEEFMEALARLTPAGLQKLRDDLSEMGINNQ